MDETDALTLCEALIDAPIKWRTALLLLLYTGLRRGELVGLQWDDIGFADKTISVKRTVQYIELDAITKNQDGVRVLYTTGKGAIIEKSPKNETSERVISIDVGEIALLTEYRKWWLQQKLLNGDRWVETDKLFVKENGGVMFPDSITDYVSKFIVKHNLPHFTPHSLRHSNISLMIANGVDLKTASSRAGHAQPTTTANIYAHQIQSANAKAAEKINDILNIKTLNRQ